MSLPIAQESPLNSLFSLKSQYEHELIETDAKAKTLREQIEHINALLFHQLLPSNSTTDTAPLQTHIETPATELLLSAQDAPLLNRLAPAPDNEEVPTPSETSKQTPTSKTPTPKPASPKGKRNLPRSMRPSYRKLTRLTAITRVMKKHQGKEVTADLLTKELFGTLKAAEHKAETKRLKTMLYKGEKEKLWQKGKTPSTYIIKEEKKNSKGSDNKKVAPAKRSTTKAKATKLQSSKVRNSLPLQQAFKGLQKHEAITAVLEKHRGTALHQDAIIEMLYGQLSPEEFKAERPRTKTALQAGVKTKKWQKSRKPACFQLPKTTKPAATKKTEPKAKVSKTVAEKAPATAATSGSATKPKRGPKANSSKAKTSPKSKATPTRKKATRGRTKKA